MLVLPVLEEKKTEEKKKNLWIETNKLEITACCSFSVNSVNCTSAQMICIVLTWSIQLNEIESKMTSWALCCFDVDVQLHLVASVRQQWEAVRICHHVKYPLSVSSGYHGDHLDLVKSVNPSLRLFCFLSMYSLFVTRAPPSVLSCYCRPSVVCLLLLFNTL